jgi:hypothetical protein
MKLKLKKCGEKWGVVGKNNYLCTELSKEMN